MSTSREIIIEKLKEGIVGFLTGAVGVTVTLIWRGAGSVFIDRYGGHWFADYVEWLLIPIAAFVLCIIMLLTGARWRTMSLLLVPTVIAYPLLVNMIPLSSPYSFAEFLVYLLFWALLFGILVAAAIRFIARVFS
jgi:hypothetical protein